MGSKISNTEWGLAIGALAAVDATQAFLNVILIGPFVNGFITMIATMSFGLYIKLRGVKFDKSLLGGLLMGFIIKIIPFLDFLPALTALGVRTMLKDIEAKKVKKTDTQNPESLPNNQQEQLKKAA